MEAVRWRPGAGLHQGEIGLAGSPSHIMAPSKKLNTLYPDGAMAVLYFSVFYKISESTGFYGETVSCCVQLNATEEQHKF